MDKGSGKSMIKTFEKHAGRAKERFLQNLGKADKTKDQLFDEYTQNFGKQQKVAEKYQRELRNYITCTRAVESSIQSLIETVSEIYEYDWAKKQELYNNLDRLVKIQSSYNQKLTDEVLGAVNSYLNQFPEIKNKVSKRGRKLTDFDGARHSLEALTNHKRREESKIQKAREQLDLARQSFEPLNAELMDELPALYNSRVPFYASNLHNLFSAEMSFHHESSEVYSELSDIIEYLAKEHKQGAYALPPSKDESFPPSPENTSPPSTPPGEVASPEENNLDKTETQQNGDQSSPSDDSVRKFDGDKSPKRSSISEPTTGSSPSMRTSPSLARSSSPPARSSSPSLRTSTPKTTIQPIPKGATLTNLPPGALYRVKTMHRYQKEDADELSFEKDEIIQVVEYDDPEEQEEGWLMGIHEPTMKKGLFPENFTKPI